MPTYWQNPQTQSGATASTPAAFGNSAAVQRAPASASNFNTAFAPSATSQVSRQTSNPLQNGYNYQAPQQQGYQPTQVQDMNSPGYGEQAYLGTAGQLGNNTYNTAGQNALNSYQNQGNPSADFWNGVAGSFNTTPNFATQAFNSTLSQMPGSLQSDFDTAFGRATQQAVGDANSQAAARGAYGSSAALNNVDSVIANMAAQKANAQSQFSLANSANQLNWQNALSNQGVAANNVGTNLLSTYGGLANQASGSENQRVATIVGQELGLSGDQINRLISGMNAGNMAQNAMQGRQQQGYNQYQGTQNDAMQALQNYYAQIQGALNPSAADQAALGATGNAVNTQANQASGANTSAGDTAALIAQIMAANRSPQAAPQAAPQSAPIPTVQPQQTANYPGYTGNY